MNDLVAYVNGAPSGRHTGRRLAPRQCEKGWEVFQAKCIQCHSVRGKGGKIGPELGPAHELPRTSAQFAAVLWNHAPAMLKQAQAAGVEKPTLQGEEITDVARFLASLRYFEPTGSAFVGRACLRRPRLRPLPRRQGRRHREAPPPRPPATPSPWSLSPRRSGATAPP